MANCTIVDDPSPEPAARADHAVPHRAQDAFAVPANFHAMAAHERFTVATDSKVYFCDPQNAWKRGTNEDTNGLLRHNLL
jgi:IS30 family transposase